MLFRTLFMVAASMPLASCSFNDNEQTRRVDDYLLTMTTDPEKLAVGKDAEITVAIERDDEPVNCHASFRQYLPTHQMATDRSWHAMQAVETGVYRGRGVEFSMGGEWELEVKFNCGTGTKTAVFSYELVWM